MRNILKPAILFLSLFSVTSTTFCQQTDLPKSLLWRISGNGLINPSYLFGTFHLTDKQLFNFSDSLYHAIEKSEGFAIEIHPDSAVTAFINGDFSQKSNRPVKSILSETDLQKIIKQMEKKVGKKAGDITEQDIIDYRDSWLRKEMFGGIGKMNTFMDGYLFDKARNMGKWVGGIEDAADQSSIMQEKLSAGDIIKIIEHDMNDKKYLGKMKELYIDQDLAGIKYLISGNVKDDFEQKMLNNRNNKMARRMDSLAHIRSNFFAVGAAHLPGEAGLINLLKSNGFLVEPVLSTHQIPAENYPFKKVEIPWQMVKNEDNFFTIKMPGIPEFMNAANGTRMQVFPDITTNLYYYAAAFNSIDNTDTIFANLQARYIQMGKILKTEDIIYQNQKGKRILLTKDSLNMDMHFIKHPVGVVLTMVASPVISQLKSPDVKKFFNSLQLNLDKKPQDFAFQNYTFSNHTFRMDFPFNPIIKKEPDDSTSAWYNTLYNALDAKTGDEYVVFVRDIKPQYYLQGGIDNLNDLNNSYLKQFNADPYVNQQTTLNNIPAIYSESTIKINGTQGVLRIYVLYKGNRSYSLLGFGSMSENSQANIKRFFNSFQLTDYDKNEWQKRQIPNSAVSTWLPQEPLQIISNAAESEITSPAALTQYYSYDKAAPVSINVDKRTLSKYYWIKNDTTLFNNVIINAMEEGDSIIYKKFFTEKEGMGVDYNLYRRAGINTKRGRCLLLGDTVFHLYAFMPQQDFQLPDYDKIFTQFKQDRETVKSTIFIKKSLQLFEALKSSDSVAFNQASETLGEVDFEKQDVPDLLKASLIKYPDFDSAYSMGANAELARIILNIDSAYTFIPFIKENYSELTAQQELLKPNLLFLLMNTPTTASFTLLKEIIANTTPRVNHLYYLKNSFYDSLQLSKILFPEIMQAAGDKGLYKMISYLTGSMLDSNFISQKELLPYKTKFFSQAEWILKTEKRMFEEAPENFYDIIHILGVINDAESNRLLNQFLKIDNKYVRIKAIIALLNNNLPVDKKHLFTIASTDEFRGLLYTGLKNSKKENLYPAEFLAQKHFAQSELYVYAMEEEKPWDIKFLKEKIEVINGEKKKLFLFKLSFNEDSFLGIAGPYSLNSKNITSTNDVLGIYWNEKFDASKINEQLQTYLDQLEEANEQ